jgi:hypothetical protein
MSALLAMRTGGAAISGAKAKPGPTLNMKEFQSRGR